MKKRMLLTSILMALVLLLALGTATFAWYSAAQGEDAKYVTDKQTVTTADNAYTAGEFTVKVVFDEVGDTAPVLTDASGKTYYYAGDENSDEVQDDNASRVISNTAKFHLEVTYAGVSDSATDIAALWNELALAVQVVITDNSKEAGNTIDGAGLKFWENQPSLASWVNGGDTITLKFNATELTFAKVEDVWTASYASDSTFHYGAKGVDDVIQTHTDVYEILATASKAE